MDVSELVTTEYTEMSGDTRVAKLVSAFEDTSCRAIVVIDDGSFEGVVTRRQIIRSHRATDQKARSLVWPLPRIGTDEDVREAAQLMLDGDVRLLPVFENQQLVGVVTADRMLAAVRENLDVATVANAHSPELVTVSPDSTLGDALHEFREHRVKHLPVIEDATAVGMLALADVVDLTARSVEKQQGGDMPGFDEHGGEGTADDYRSHGGHGAREGELERMLELPVRDKMSSPVRTVQPPQTLDVAVEKMFDATTSSLLVTEEERPRGILTKSDVLDTLTWEAKGHRAVQVYGTEHIDDMTYDDIVDMVETLEQMDGSLDLQDVRIHVNQHQERRRGTPLLHVRVRLSTNRGLISASEEGYGASHALNEVEDVLKRRIREGKTAGQSKKHPSEEFWEKRFGWYLSE